MNLKMRLACGGCVPLAHMVTDVAKNDIRPNRTYCRLLSLADRTKVP